MNELQFSTDSGEVSATSSSHPQLVDGNQNTKINSEMIPVIIELEFQSPVSLKTFTIIRQDTCNACAFYQSPKDFYLATSANRLDWDIVARIANEEWVDTADTVERVYEIDSPTSVTDEPVIDTTAIVTDEPVDDSLCSEEVRDNVRDLMSSAASAGSESCFEAGLGEASDETYCACVEDLDSPGVASVIETYDVDCFLEAGDMLTVQQTFYNCADVCEPVICGCAPGLSTFEETDESGCVTSCTCVPDERIRKHIDDTGGDYADVHVRRCAHKLELIQLSMPIRAMLDLLGLRDAKFQSIYRLPNGNIRACRTRTGCLPW